MGGIGAMALGYVMLAQAWSEPSATCAPCEGGASREMAGHVFIPTELAPQPFAATYFRNVTDVAHSQGDGPFILPSGLRAGNQTYTQLGVGVEFELQIAVTDWLTVRGGGNFFAYTGITGPSALVLGQVASYRLLLGATVSRQFGDRFRVGFAVDAGPSPVYKVNVLDGIEEAIQNRDVDTGRIFSHTTASVLIPAVTAAYTLHQSLGALAAISWEHPFGTTSTPNSTTDSLAFTGLVDFDSRPFWPVPIGAIAGYRLTVPLSDVGVTQDFAFGLFYTAHRSLVLGVEGDLRKIPDQTFAPSTILIAQIVFRYYW